MQTLFLSRKKKKHYGFTSYNYLCGNRGDYNTVDNCFVTTYVSKDNKGDAIRMKHIALQF